MKNETWTLPSLQTLGHSLPGTGLAVYFSHAFQRNRAYDLSSNNEFYWLINSAGLGLGEGFMISIRTDSIGGGRKGHGAPFMRMRSVDCIGSKQCSGYWGSAGGGWLL